MRRRQSGGKTCGCSICSWRCCRQPSGAAAAGPGSVAAITDSAPVVAGDITGTAAADTAYSDHDAGGSQCRGASGPVGRRQRRSRRPWSGASGRETGLVTTGRESSYQFEVKLWAYAI